MTKEMDFFVCPSCGHVSMRAEVRCLGRFSKFISPKTKAGTTYQECYVLYDVEVIEILSCKCPKCGKELETKIMPCPHRWEINSDLERKCVWCDEVQTRECYCDYSDWETERD